MMERNFTNEMSLALRGILVKNKSIGNRLSGSLLQSLAFLFFMLFLSLSLFTEHSAYASKLPFPGINLE